jgi:hypothetical protein
MAKLYTCSWGGVRLYAVSFSTNAGRSLSIHDPARGKGFVVQDRGPVLSNVRAEIVFSDVDGEPDYHDRYKAFRETVNKGTPQLFVHPVYGSYRASIGACDEVIDAEGDRITVSAEFVPSVDFDPVATTGPGVTPIAGPESVAGAQAYADEQLAAVGLSSSATAAATAAAESWAERIADGVSDARGVYLEYSQRVAELDEMILELELAELPTWTAYRSIVALRERLREAALAATSPTVRTRRYEVGADVPLLILMARLFGATAAASVADQVADLNDIRDRALVAAGTVLLLPVEAA